MDGFESIDPDSLRVDLTIFREEDRPRHVLPDGRSVLGGESLAAFVERIGGWSGEVTDPWGGTHHVSVEALADANPERTFVQIGFRTKPVVQPDPDPSLWERLQATPVEHLVPHAVYAGDEQWGANRDPEQLPGRTLREMRELLGGDEGYMEDRHGKRHWVSVRLWKDADPDTTRIVIKAMHGRGTGDEQPAPAE